MAVDLQKYLDLEEQADADAVEVDSDLIRSHLNNIAGVIVGLREALRQEAAWKRP